MEDHNFIKYVAQVIQIKDADVVGIMELVGWLGNEIRDKLVKELNNLEKLKNSGVIWWGEASEMTPSRPNEQYLFLWKTNLLIDPQWQLWNVVGEMMFDDFFNKYNYSPDDQKKFWKSLQKHGYLDAEYMIPWSKWVVLSPDQFDLMRKEPSFDLNNAQKKEVVDLLYKIEPQAFPLRGSRPPFLLRARTSDSNTDVSFLLYHAPGPGNPLPRIASNQLNPAMEHAQVGVIMGDFNVKKDEASNLMVLQYFNRDSGKIEAVKTTDKQFIYVHPFQRITGPEIDPKVKDGRGTILTSVLHFTKTLWESKTSITSTLVNPPNTIASDAKISGLLSSEYDKFFVKVPQPDPSKASVVPLIDHMIPKKNSTTSTEYYPELGNLATEIYNKWWKRQNEKKKKSEAVEDMLKKAPQLNRPPEWMFEAHYVYHHAISDHLPICMEIQYV
ncbi:hypothetical protein AB6A23_13880 [Paenibacillus tarimensis]